MNIENARLSFMRFSFKISLRVEMKIKMEHLLRTLFITIEIIEVL